MKISAVFFLLFLAGSTAAQNGPVEDEQLDYRDFIYEPAIDCEPCPPFQPGQKVPASHPNAPFLNDTSLWEWKEGPYPGSKVYDLKPQYKDTLIRHDGSVIEVPVWIKYPGWRKKAS